MAREQHNNSGILFKNDKKESKKHPDRNGSATVGGIEYWVSGWIKEGQKGPFMTLSFTPKEKKQNSQRSSSRFEENLDDEIPF